MPFLCLLYYSENSMQDAKKTIKMFTWINWKKTAFMAKTSTH